ncbi:hypothetical protein Pcinc_040849 [Petrolisthes cinctipes]|uniref:Uncharacterized protein n=1 Tax=Petrolisthes cinctipes TaxID=88211 RepID=A0AAE1BKQ4_PETCI|nr:hypothetical protein Pcinc_040849 [Petrolisthes cinctipes]
MMTNRCTRKGKTVDRCGSKEAEVGQTGVETRRQRWDKTGVETRRESGTGVARDRTGVEARKERWTGVEGKTGGQVWRERLEGQVCRERLEGQVWRERLEGQVWRDKSGGTGVEGKTGGTGVEGKTGGAGVEGGLEGQATFTLATGRGLGQDYLSSARHTNTARGHLLLLPPPSLYLRPPPLVPLSRAATPPSAPLLLPCLKDTHLPNAPTTTTQTLHRTILWAL